MSARSRSVLEQVFCHMACSICQSVSGSVGHVTMVISNTNPMVNCKVWLQANETGVLDHYDEILTSPISNHWLAPDLIQLLHLRK